MIKILILLLAFFFYGSLLNAQFDIKPENNLEVNKKQHLLYGVNELNTNTETKEVSFEINQNKKSPGIALILSLAIPGAGHLYLDRMDVGKFFTTFEALNVLGLVGVNVYGNSILDNAKSYSMIHAGVQNIDREKSYFANVAFYNSVYDYNNDKLARGEFSLIYDIDKFYWFWDSEASRHIYDGQRKKSERIKNTEIIFGTAMIVNRISSAISAMLIANSQNSGSGFGINTSLLKKPDNSLDGIVLNLYKNF